MVRRVVDREVTMYLWFGGDWRKDDRFLGSSGRFLASRRFLV